MVGGWINPLQTLPQGLVLTFDFDPDPELDKNIKGPVELYVDNKDRQKHLLFWLWSPQYIFYLGTNDCNYKVVSNKKFIILKKHTRYNSFTKPPVIKSQWSILIWVTWNKL